MPGGLDEAAHGPDSGITYDSSEAAFVVDSLWTWQTGRAAFYQLRGVPISIIIKTTTA